MGRSIVVPRQAESLTHISNFTPTLTPTAMLNLIPASILTFRPVFIPTFTHTCTVTWPHPFKPALKQILATPSSLHYHQRLHLHSNSLRHTLSHLTSYPYPLPYWGLQKLKACIQSTMTSASVLTPVLAFTLIPTFLLCYTITLASRLVRMHAIVLMPAAALNSNWI